MTHQWWRPGILLLIAAGAAIATFGGALWHFATTTHTAMDAQQSGTAMDVQGVGLRCISVYHDVSVTDVGEGGMRSGLAYSTGDVRWLDVWHVSFTGVGPEQAEGLTMSGSPQYGRGSGTVYVDRQAGRCLKVQFDVVRGEPTSAATPGGG